MRWYKRDGIRWKCIHCDIKSDSQMGMTSHIRKHKRELSRMQKQTKLSDDPASDHKPTCQCLYCEQRREMTGQ